MKNIARIHKALADETRLRIVSLLMTAGKLCVCDLMKALNLPQSTASRHLAYLRDSGLINDERKGIWMYYSIQDNGDIVSEVFKSLKIELHDNQIVDRDRRRLLDYLAIKKAGTCS